MRSVANLFVFGRKRSKLGQRIELSKRYDQSWEGGIEWKYSVDRDRVVLVSSVYILFKAYNFWVSLFSNRHHDKSRAKYAPKRSSPLSSFTAFDDIHCEYTYVYFPSIKLLLLSFLCFLQPPLYRMNRQVCIVSLYASLQIISKYPFLFPRSVLTTSSAPYRSISSRLHIASYRGDQIYIYFFFPYFIYNITSYLILVQQECGEDLNTDIKIMIQVIPSLAYFILKFTYTAIGNVITRLLVIKNIYTN